MNEHTLDLAGLIGSRICHDLISPIGAINNGLELISMSGAPLSPEFALISESVEAANARIRFFRISYGPASDIQFLDHREVTSILRDTTKGSKLSLRWDPVEDLPRSEVQLAFLAIQCAEQALPYGGDVHIRRNGPRWILELEADRLLLEPSLWNRFSEKDGPKTDQTVIPAHVQFNLLPALAASKGRRVDCIPGEKRAVLTV